MHPAELLALERISVVNTAGSKKRALEEAANLLTSGTTEEPTNEQVFERLLERERLGSTGLAGGVALPHARIPGVEQPRGAFLSLATPIEFDALDGQPVDLVFAMFVPEEATDEHLQLLAELARLFADPKLCQRLRETTDPAAVPRLRKGELPGDAASGPGPGSVQLPA